MLVSQPLKRLVSQSPRPDEHAGLQVLFTQLFDVVPVVWQTKPEPQPPQFASSLARLVVQPFSGLAQDSQLPLHVGTQLPEVQAVALALVVPHTVPHEPQSCTSELMLDSQPSASPPSQSRQLPVQPSKAQAPDAQWAVACA